MQSENPQPLSSNQQPTAQPLKWYQRLLRKNSEPSMENQSQPAGKRPSGTARARGHAAGGFVGLMGMIGLGLIAGLLFITENFFFAMLLFSIGLLLYTTGTEIVRIVISLMTAFFSTKHLTEDAALIGETGRMLKESL